MFKDQRLLLEETSHALEPFAHFCSTKVFSDEDANAILDWFMSCNHWHFTKTNFYTQYEFSLLDLKVPDSINFLKSETFITDLKYRFQDHLQAEGLELVGITAHKLNDGHRMGVHNDFIGTQETHRLVIQLNENWQPDHGGYLMLFNSKDPKDVATIVQPLHNTALGFEISGKSYHAVSTVYNFQRYTLVYTLKSIYM